MGNDNLAITEAINEAVAAAAEALEALNIEGCMVNNLLAKTEAIAEALEAINIEGCMDNDLLAKTEAMAEALEANSIMEDSLATFSSKIDNLLGQVKKNPELFANNPYVKIRNLEKILESLNVPGNLEKNNPGES